MDGCPKELQANHHPWTMLMGKIRSVYPEGSENGEAHPSVFLKIYCFLTENIKTQVQ
jgi:hypothetical protein